MRLGNLSKAFAIAATVAWATGCSTTSTTTDSSDAMTQSDTTAQEGASSMGTGSDGAMSGGSMSGDTSAADLAALAKVFYFDFDQAVIHSDDLAALNAHAEYLAQNPAAHVVLEGHADERGTREYNMALGERRAKAVARYLTVQGVGAGQIETVSYGEERPAVIGHSEDSWGKNRRVELAYSR